MKGIIIALIVGLTVGIVATVIVSPMILSDTSKKEIDLDYARQLQEIDNCMDLKKEYELIKKYDSNIRASEMYLKVIDDRAKEIVKYPVVCNYK